jgi:exodeoxyribonuclease-3
MILRSWNINGIRAAERKGFARWLSHTDSDVVALQEVRAAPDAIPPHLRQPEGWHAWHAAAHRPGYSGVSLLARQAADEVCTSLDDPDIDAEGRLLLARFGGLRVASVYFPNGSGRDRDNSRVPFKLAFYDRLLAHLERLDPRRTPTVVLGDWNTAHRAIDLARPRANETTSGFLPEEREAFQRWLDAGWTDAFRHFHPDAADAYTWWSQRQGVRDKNIGWRIDCALVSPAALPLLRRAWHEPEVQGSDHCPIGVEVDAPPAPA